MDRVALASWLNQASGMSAVVVAAVGLAGLLVGVAPSSLPLYSVVAGYVGGQAGGRARGILLSFCFILGQATVDAGIGVLFGFLGLAVIVAIARSAAARGQCRRQTAGGRPATASRSRRPRPVPAAPSACTRGTW
jgi:cytochrome c biogenesis protein CcdA